MFSTTAQNWQPLSHWHLLCRCRGVARSYPVDRLIMQLSTPPSSVFWLCVPLLISSFFWPYYELSFQALSLMLTESVLVPSYHYAVKWWLKAGCDISPLCLYDYKGWTVLCGQNDAVPPSKGEGFPSHTLKMCVLEAFRARHLAWRWMSGASCLQSCRNARGYLRVLLC